MKSLKNYLSESLNEGKKLNIKQGNTYKVVTELDVDIDSDNSEFKGKKSIDAKGYRIKVTKVKNDWITAELYNDEGDDQDTVVEFGLDDMSPLKKIRSVTSS